MENARPKNATFDKGGVILMGRMIEQKRLANKIAHHQRKQMNLAIQTMNKWILLN
jgi:hypothetical protein